MIPKHLNSFMIIRFSFTVKFKHIPTKKITNQENPSTEIYKNAEVQYSTVHCLLQSSSTKMQKAVY